MTASPPVHAPVRTPVCVLKNVNRARTDSLACLRCHDGTIAPAAQFGRGHPDPAGHPVDADYARARARLPQAYAPPGALPRTVPLVDGKVTCTSCHDAGSPYPAHTSMPMRGSALCFACHTL